MSKCKLLNLRRFCVFIGFGLISAFKFSLQFFWPGQGRLSLPDIIQLVKGGNITTDVIANFMNLHD